MKLRYAVIGTGALGGFYGGMLARAGAEVHFLLNGDYEHVKKNGLKVDSVHGNFTLRPVSAWHDTAQMPPCDVVLVCLKTTNNGLLKEILSPLVTENSVVVLVQNGLGMEKELATWFPGLPVAGGLAFICSSKIGKGHIAHFDYGKITFGAYQHEKPEVMQQICRDFEQAGVPAMLADDLYLARWKKLVWNIPYNGLTVALNTSTDRLMKSAPARLLITEMMLEVIAAANCCGAEIPESFAAEMLVSTDRMKPYAPSMKLDYDAGRPMEIEAIYSNPVATARAAGFDMKKTAMLSQLLQFIQAKNGLVS